LKYVVSIVGSKVVIALCKYGAEYKKVFATMHFFGERHWTPCPPSSCCSHVLLRIQYSEWSLTINYSDSLCLICSLRAGIFFSKIVEVHES
jgi:hypothetical protein